MCEPKERGKDRLTLVFLGEERDLQGVYRAQHVVVLAGLGRRVEGRG